MRAVQNTRSLSLAAERRDPGGVGPRALIARLGQHLRPGKELGLSRPGGLTRRGATLLLTACAAATLAGCGSGPSGAGAGATPAATHSSAPGLHGMIPTPLPVKPAFSLTSTSGQAYSFVPATRGKLTYLFFGYTHCPDVCPATMSFLAAAVRQQPVALRRQIAVVFVTVDPARDTGPVIRRWLNHYNRSFVGLTGSEAEIATVERDAGLPVAPRVRKSPSAAYTVTHSSFLLAYSPDERAHVLYVSGFKEADYAHDMPILLRFR